MLSHIVSFEVALILSSARSNVYHYGDNWEQIFRLTYKLTPNFQGEKVPKFVDLYGEIYDK